LVQIGTVVVSEDQAKKILNNLSEEDQKKLKVLKLEYEMWKYEDFKVLSS
jgi:hypothetical protein